MDNLIHERLNYFYYTVKTFQIEADTRIIMDTGSWAKMPPKFPTIWEQSWQLRGYAQCSEISYGWAHSITAEEESPSRNEHAKISSFQMILMSFLFGLFGKMWSGTFHEVKTLSWISSRFSYDFTSLRSLIEPSVEARATIGCVPWFSTAREESVVPLSAPNTRVWASPISASCTSYGRKSESTNQNTFRRFQVFLKLTFVNQG